MLKIHYENANENKISNHSVYLPSLMSCYNHLENFHLLDSALIKE